MFAQFEWHESIHALCRLDGSVFARRKDGSALFGLAFLPEIGDDSGSSPGNRTSQEQAQLDKV
jgi:hypothetical protein